MFLLFAVKNNTPKYFKIHLLTQVFTFRPQPYPFDPWRSQPSQKVFRQLNYSLQTVSNRSGSSLPDGLFMLQYFFRRFVRNWSGPSGKVTNTYSSLHTPTRNKNKAVQANIHNGIVLNLSYFFSPSWNYPVNEIEVVTRG